MPTPYPDALIRKVLYSVEHEGLASALAKFEGAREDGKAPRYKIRQWAREAGLIEDRQMSTPPRVLLSDHVAAMAPTLLPRTRDQIEMIGALIGRLALGDDTQKLAQATQAYVRLVRMSMDVAEQTSADAVLDDDEAREA